MKYDAVDGTIHLLTAASNKWGECPAMQIFENRSFFFCIRLFLLNFGGAVEMIGSKRFHLSCPSVKYTKMFDFLEFRNEQEQDIESKCIVEQ